MRVLVVSDVHGKLYLLREAIEAQPTARDVIFLGDGLRQVEDVMDLYPDRTFYTVPGNCDFYSYFKGEPAKKTETLSLSGYRITATHGDLFGVKYGSAELIKLARDTKSDIVLFGHTHSPYTKYISDYEKPFYLFNPGSISASSGYYGIMTLGDMPFFSHGEIT